MSNSYFIALTLGMAAVTFSSVSFIGRRQDPDVRAGDQNATLRAGHRSAGHHHHSDPEREFQHGVRLKNPKVIAAIICTLASFRLGGVGGSERRRLAGVVKLFYVTV